jgi:hypothetical protein
MCCIDWLNPQPKADRHERSGNAACIMTLDVGFSLTSGTTTLNDFIFSKAVFIAFKAKAQGLEAQSPISLDIGNQQPSMHSPAVNEHIVLVIVIEVTPSNAPTTAYGHPWQYVRCHISERTASVVLPGAQLARYEARNLDCTDQQVGWHAD